MKRAVLAIVFLIAVPGAIRPQEEEVPAPPEVGVSKVEGGGFRSLEAVVPGFLVSHLVIQDRRLDSAAADPRVALVLVEPEEEPGGPRALYRIDLGGESDPQLLVADLPEGAGDLVSLDLDGDARDEILIATAGGLEVISSQDGWESVDHRRELAIEHPLAEELHLGSRPRELGPTPAAFGALALATVGTLAVFDFEDGSRLVPSAAYRLPVRVRRGRTGLALSSPRVTRWWRAEGPPEYLIGPLAEGFTRLQIPRIRPSLEEPTTEAWARLPTLEKVQSSRYLLLGGQPHLVVLTRSAEKLGIFEHSKLRVFPLAGDRTRSGVAPVLATKVKARIWQNVEIQAADLNGDGAEDLIAAQPAGMGEEKILVEAYLADGNGGFEAKTIKSRLQAEARRWRYGGDFDADGRPDLAVQGGGRLQVFRGREPSKKGGLLEEKPKWSVPLIDTEIEEVIEVAIGSDGNEVHRLGAELGSRMEVVDLDGDGRDEILLRRPSVRGRGVLQVIWFDPDD